MDDAAGGDARRLKEEEERPLLNVGVLGERGKLGALLVQQEDLGEGN